jgi:hypothetical protein
VWQSSQIPTPSPVSTVRFDGRPSERSHTLTEPTSLNPSSENRVIPAVIQHPPLARKPQKKRVTPMDTAPRQYQSPAEVAVPPAQINFSPMSFFAGRKTEEGNRDSACEGREVLEPGYLRYSVPELPLTREVRGALEAHYNPQQSSCLERSEAVLQP